MSPDLKQPITNSSGYQIWPFPDSPACVIYEAHDDTFLAQPAQPSDQTKAKPRHSIGIPNVLTAFVVREDLLICLRSKTIGFGRELFGFAIPQEPGGPRCIAGRGQRLGAAKKDIEKSTATAVHVVDGKSELVLCTTVGKVLRYVES